jgi:hypothetical protein
VERETPSSTTIYEWDDAISPPSSRRLPLRCPSPSSGPVSLRSALRNCGLWEDTAARGPPAATPTQDQLALELQYV